MKENIYVSKWRGNLEEKKTSLRRKIYSIYNCINMKKEHMRSNSLFGEVNCLMVKQPPQTNKSDLK